MNQMRLALLGVFFALLVAALGGAGTASAAVLCNANINPCPAANIVGPAPFNIAGVSPVGAVFTMGPNQVVCAGSTYNDRILNNPGLPINDAVQNWTFGGCVLNPGGIACNVVANPAAPLGWPTRLSTPATNPLADGDFALDGFNVTITCAGFAPCTVAGANPAQNMGGDWYNPTTLSPPKPIASPHAVVDFPNTGIVIVGGGAPCANGTFKASYETTIAPFAGPDLWLF